VSLCFSSNGESLVTGSFDHTTRLWDVQTGKSTRSFVGHEGEISSAQFNFSGDHIVSGSIDTTVKLWDVATAKCVYNLGAHSDEILDVAFNNTGSQIVSASADTTACGNLHLPLEPVCVCTSLASYIPSIGLSVL
jgi:dynein assembly factor with WDR repeat domains 1